MGSNANTGVEEERKEQEERFAQAVARLEALEAQAQTYKQALEERDATIAAQGAQMQRMAQERLEERFAAEAQTYTALGVKADVLAPELVWLYSIDDSDGRAHFQFFRGMLRQVDASLQRSGAFNERGASTSPSGTTWDVISRKITSLAKERGIDAPEGSAAYNQLSMEVLDTEPDLYDQYRAEIQSAA